MTQVTLREYAVTGTLHGSLITTTCEGEARRAFHKLYNGESITNVRLRGKYTKSELDWLLS